MLNEKRNILELAKYGGTNEEVDIAMMDMLSDSEFNINNYRDEWLYTPLHYAAMNGSEYIVKSFLSRISQVYNIKRVSKIKNDTIYMLFDVYAETKYGATPFQFAMIPGNCIEMMRIFLMYGYDINYQNNVGNTALMIAVLSNNFLAVDFLLKNKALINIKNNRNRDVFAYNKTAQIYKILLMYKYIQDLSVDNNDSFDETDMKFKRRNLSV